MLVVERKYFAYAIEIQLYCIQERMTCISVKTIGIHIYVKNLYSTGERLKKNTLHYRDQRKINPASIDVTQTIIIIINV